VLNKKTRIPPTTNVVKNLCVQNRVAMRHYFDTFTHARALSGRNRIDTPNTHPPHGKMDNNDDDSLSHYGFFHPSSARSAKASTLAITSMQTQLAEAQDNLKAALCELEVTQDMLASCRLEAHLLKQQKEATARELLGVRRLLSENQRALACAKAEVRHIRSQQQQEIQNHQLGWLRGDQQLLPPPLPAARVAAADLPPAYDDRISTATTARVLPPPPYTVGRPAERRDLDIRTQRQLQLEEQQRPPLKGRIFSRLFSKSPAGDP
jgi:hypothetical protein